MDVLKVDLGVEIGLILQQNLRKSTGFNVDRVSIPERLYDGNFFEMCSIQFHSSRMSTLNMLVPKAICHRGVHFSFGPCWGSQFAERGPRITVC